MTVMTDFAVLAGVLQQQIQQLQVHADPTILHDYIIDGVEPKMVITPASVDDAVLAIQNLQNYPLTILPYGGGTTIHSGGMAEHIDVILRTVALKHLLEHEAPDLTCHVEAGITLTELQNKLAWKGQYLPLDPPDADHSTIGGLLASNMSGPKRFRYGTARDLVIGLHVILANGDLVRSGGRVVKNVAGYDLNKLYIGSRGTLGIIVEANFKLLPLPDTERTLLFSFTSAADAMQAALSLLQSPLTPSAIELINPQLQGIPDALASLVPGDDYTLAVNFEGSTIAITRQIDETLHLVNAHHASRKNDVEGQEQTQFWQAVRHVMSNKLVCKICILPSQVSDYMNTIEQSCYRHRLGASIIVHAGNGILYVALDPHDIDATTSITNAITELRIQAQVLKGNFMVERCPLPIKQHLNVWEEPRSNFYLMQRLKQQFDPQELFVRGRFLGGL